MMLTTTPTLSKVLILGTLLMTTGLAGCMGGEEAAFNCSEESAQNIEITWDSYQEAKNAPGEVYEANNTDSPIQLKLLDPQNAGSIDEGGLPVTVLLYNSDTDEPVTDASFVVNARMPAMGHGTTPETDPIHRENGIYTGCTTIGMPGDWLINLDPQLSDGTVLEYDVEASTAAAQS